MSIINQIESLINEIESLLKKQNLELNENTEINDLIKTKRELIRRIEKEFLESEKGMRRALSYLDGEENKPISEFLEYLLGKLSYLKDLIEKELVLDKSGEIEREIEILHFELKTILGIKDNEYFKNLVGLYTRVSQSEEEVLEEHKNLVNEYEIELLTSGIFISDYIDKIKKIFSSNEGILLLRLLKENSKNNENYRNILGKGLHRIVCKKNIRQLKDNEMLMVVREFVNLRKNCESDRGYRTILEHGFGCGVLENSKIQQLEVNKLLEVIRKFIKLRKDCRSDEYYTNILTYGFHGGILENSKIQQLDLKGFLKIIEIFGNTFINLGKYYQSDYDFGYVLGFGFGCGIFENSKIKQLEVDELLEIIKISGKEFSNLKNKEIEIFKPLNILIKKIVLDLNFKNYQKKINLIINFFNKQVRNSKDKIKIIKKLENFDENKIISYILLYYIKYRKNH